MPSLTDPTDTLSRLQKTLESGTKVDVEDAMWNVVSDYDSLVDETKRLRQNLTASMTSADLTDSEARQTINAAAYQLGKASIRRGNLLNQIAVYSSTDDDVGRDALKSSVELNLKHEEQLQDVVSATENILPGVTQKQVAPAVSSGGISASPGTVTPGESVTVSVGFENLGNEPTSKAKLSVTVSPESATVSDVPAEIGPIPPGERVQAAFTVVPETSDVFTVSVTAETSRQAAIEQDTVVISRTQQEAAAYRKATRDLFNPLADLEDAKKTALGVGGAGVLGAGLFAARRWKNGRTDEERDAQQREDSGENLD